MIRGCSALAGALNIANLGSRAGDICGKKGHDRGAFNYDYNDSGKFSTLADCSKRCLASSKCLVYGYGGKECMLFSVALANNFDADSSSSGLRGSTPTSTAPASTVSYYPGCKASDFKQTYEITSLNWFNSTNNLDCAVNGQPNYPSSGKVCVDTATNTLCDPSKLGSPSTCKFEAYCSPTAPSAASQPPGYGPPDIISISIADFAYPTCTESDPMTPLTGVRALGIATIGNGDVNCGPKHNYLNFFRRQQPGPRAGAGPVHPGGLVCGPPGAVRGHVPAELLEGRWRQCYLRA